MNESYLGDGAYIKDGSYKGEIVIYTSNGIEDTNTVALGQPEIRNLESWLNNWKERMPL